jgi:hypothetical protein
MKRTARRWVAVVSAAAAIGAFTSVSLTGSAAASVTGAAFTTTNPNVDTPPTGTDLCLNGNPAVNCNLYTNKDYVWLSGGPSTAGLSDGTYFFAVLAPGGQHDPNDGTSHNLSSPHDAYTDRTFSISGGTISYSGPHTFDSNLIRLMPYDDTPNPGGVYILAICNMADATGIGSLPGVKPSECKYDAFKVEEATPCTENCGGNSNSDLGVTMDVAPRYTVTHPWSVSKTLTNTSVSSGASNASATFTFDVTATRGDDEYSATQLYGSIWVSNSNNFDVNGVTGSVAQTSGSGGTLGTCTYTDSNDDPVPAGGLTAESGILLQIQYVCDISDVGTPPDATGDLEATFNWDYSGYVTPTATAPSEPVPYDFGATDVNDITVVGPTSVDVYDKCSNAPTATLLGTTSTTHTYSGVTCTFTIPSGSCLANASNTASIYAAGANIANTDPIDTVTVPVSVCGNGNGFTMGYWQNKNGQALIKANVAGLCSYLFGYPTTSSSGGPFNNVWASGPAKPTSGNCTSNGVLATWVTNVIKAANASMTGAPMFEGQFLATALDAYFSSALAGTHVLVSSTVASALGESGTCLTVGTLLADGNSHYSSLASGSKTTFMAVKDVYDRINNGVALTC